MYLANEIQQLLLNCIIDSTVFATFSGDLANVRILQGMKLHGEDLLSTGLYRMGDNFALSEFKQDQLWKGFP